jgi:hypothetical protein
MVEDKIKKAKKELKEMLKNQALAQANGMVTFNYLEYINSPYIDEDVNKIIRERGMQYE